MSQTRVSIFPDVADTVCHVHDPDTGYDGKPRRIVAFVAGASTVQFQSVAEAYDWLEHCNGLLVASAEARQT